MNLRWKIFILIMMVIVGLGVLMWPLLPAYQIATNRNLQQTVAKRSPDQVSGSESNYGQAPTQVVPPEILEEAVRAGQIDNHPAVTEERLNEIAQKLRPEEMVNLEEIVKTPSNDGDLRAVAVDLLARSSAEEALQPLEDIIFSEWPKNQEERMIDFERALRARAVEGLQNHPSDKAMSSLSRGSALIDDPFLRDRNRRALLYREGKVPRIEDQDRDALDKILRQ